MLFDPLLSLCLATDGPATPQTLWSSWGLAPQTTLPLLGLPLLYLAYARRDLRRRPAHGLCFGVGWLALAAALVSPLCRAAASLASAHMVQHVLLVAVAPPLLLLGVPAFFAADGGLRLARGAARQPFAAGALYAAAIWFAHLPAIYQAALRGAAAHLALLGALLAASLFFWAAVLAAWRDPARPDAAATGMALCFSAMVQTSLLGALLTLSRGPWYPVFIGRSSAFGLSPLDDQQLGGAIMWMPMGAIYLVAGLALAARWLDGFEARIPLGEARRRR